MAVFNGTIKSTVLGMDTNIVVILPYDEITEEQEPCKVLYLLHGLSDNAQAWSRYSSVGRYAREAGYAVIMPEVQRSFYIDMEYGLDYFTYVSEELPAICAKMFHLSNKREDTFIAGLSMGGYGAMKCALTFPERYAACGCFSSAFDIEGVFRIAEEEGKIKEFQAAVGMDLIIGDENNLKVLADELTAIPSYEHPRIFITCGKQDFIYHHSVDFVEHLKSLEIDFTYHEWDGVHNWAFWDKSIQMALSFFAEK